MHLRSRFIATPLPAGSVLLPLPNELWYFILDHIDDLPYLWTTIRHVSPVLRDITERIFLCEYAPAMFLTLSTGDSPYNDTTFDLTFCRVTEDADGVILKVGGPKIPPNDIVRNHPAAIVERFPVITNAGVQISMKLGTLLPSCYHLISKPSDVLLTRDESAEDGARSHVELSWKTLLRNFFEAARRFKMGEPFDEGMVSLKNYSNRAGGIIRIIRLRLPF
ncbi:hypothetical protein BDV96DRAFT_687299 [Lophiotrema nucula]|uniref:F-box domain-containing protein n=1 Tax=Lophiotrema nucula TaxID=690887 RepID=A0A6A5Z845_9PLEO|nr:hypothetical protein BDV96DRAFT_687299 [Lophiotrema nucula]